MSLTATVTFADGSSLVYDAAAGQDLGNYTGPGFVQQCIRCSLPTSPLTVYFRPDQGSSRIEVVFELGRMWGAANAAAADLGAYTAVIAQDDTILATVSVPKHFWFSRWRWQSAPRPVLSQPLGSLGFAPFDPTLLTHVTQPPVHSYAGPMDNAGIYINMGTTGDRPDLGVLTEWTSCYLATGSQAALGTLLAQAEAGAGSIPWCYRDENTGAPVSFYSHPGVYWYSTPVSGAVGPFVHTVKPVRLASGFFDRIAFDDAHAPSLCFVPYLLTGDPYFLEGLQFHLTAAIGWEIYHRALRKVPVLFYPSQTRSWAWSLRTAAELAACTPASVPSWLQPQSYWQQVLADNRAWYESFYVQSTQPEMAVFRAATRPDEVAPWQDDYTILAMCHAVELGLDEWKPLLEWKAGSRIALADGQHGWDVQAPCPYYYYVRKTPSDPTTDFTSWQDAWNAYLASPPLQGPLPPRPPLPQIWGQGSVYGYCYWALGTVAWLVRLGIPGASLAYQNLRVYIDYALSHKNSVGNPQPLYTGRYSFAFAPTPRVSRDQVAAVLSQLGTSVSTAESQAASALSSLGLNPGTVAQDYVQGKLTLDQVYSAYGL